MKKKWRLVPKQFAGTLSLNDDQVEVAFTVGLDVAGNIDLTFNPFPEDKKSAFIRTAFHDQDTRFINFFLGGSAEDGTTFECNNLIITNLNNRPSEKFLTIAPTAHYTSAILAIHGDRSNLPVLIWSIRGFESFRSLKTSSPLGTVEMVGARESNGKNEICGFVRVSADKWPQDVEEWRKNADALCLDIQHIMSFAAGVKLGCPLSEFFHEELIKIEAYSQGQQESSAFPVFSWLDLNGIFESAVRWHFKPEFTVHNIDFAIQWFNMRGTYRETNLISSMTVLENLIDSNLSEADTLILSSKQFERLRKKLSAVIKEQAVEWTDDEKKQQTFVHEFNNRFSDLKRRSLIDKIALLAQRWGVKLDDIPESEIREAKSARDQVVHRGHYVPKAATTGDLHDHLLVIREIVVRFILTALQFEGSYMSYIGGYHSRRFEKNPIDLNYQS